MSTNYPPLVYLAVFDVLFGLVTWRLRQSGLGYPKLLAGAAIIAVLVNASILFCRPRIFESIAGFGGAAMIVLLMSTFAGSVTRPPDR